MINNVNASGWSESLYLFGKRRNSSVSACFTGKWWLEGVTRIPLYLISSDYYGSGNILYYDGGGYLYQDGDDFELSYLDLTSRSTARTSSKLPTATPRKYFPETWLWQSNIAGYSGAFWNFCHWLHSLFYARIHSGYIPLYQSNLI